MRLAILVVVSGVLFAADAPPAPEKVALGTEQQITYLESALAATKAEITWLNTRLRYLELRMQSEGAIDRARQVEQLVIKGYDDEFRKDGPAAGAVKKKAQDAETEALTKIKAALGVDKDKDCKVTPDGKELTCTPASK